MRSFLVTGFCFSFFFHAAPFLFVAPAAPAPKVAFPATECVFLGAILGDVDVAPPQAREAVGPSRRVDILKKAPGDAPGRLPGAGRLPEKPFSPPLQEESRKIFREAPPATPAPPAPEIVFDLSDAGRYFMDIDFSDIIKMVARDEFSGAVAFDVSVSSRGVLERLHRVMGSGDPVLDNMIALRLKRAVMRSSWAQRGGRCRVKIILRSFKGAYVPN